MELRQQISFYSFKRLLPHLMYKYFNALFNVIQGIWKVKKSLYTKVRSTIEKYKDIMMSHSVWQYLQTVNIWSVEEKTVL
jgi:hypothetical protein